MTEDIVLPWEAQPEPFLDSLRAQASKLAMLRQEVQSQEAGIKEARQAFEATLADRARNLEALKREVEATESAVRGMALVEHSQTNNTKPCPGVSVVMTKEYEVDEAAGLTWARTTRMCLVPEALDIKAVKKMATVTSLPFVVVHEKPSVRIASDLGAALEAA